MATEAEFEREAAHMLSNMGLKEPDTLHYFQSSNFTSGNEKWKEGLRKPASPPRVRRFRAPPREPRTEVDGAAMRKHIPVNGTHSRTSNFPQQTTPEVSSTSDTAQTKPVRTIASYSGQSHHPYAARTKSAPENGHRSHDSVGTGHHSENGEHRSVVSPRHQYAVHPSSKATSSVKTVTQASISKPATVVKVKSTHIPMPVARTVPVQTVTKLPAPTLKGTSTFPVMEREEDKKYSTGTKVLYARKPSLKLLSVTTSTSTKVQSVADSSKSDNPPPKTHLKSTSHRHPPATTQQHIKSTHHTDHSTTAFPSSIPQLQQPQSPNTTGHVYQAYDRLEGYREVVLSSPELAKSDGSNSNPKLSDVIYNASPTRCSSVNSDASQGSNVSVKSSASSGAYGAYDKRPPGQSSAIPRLRKRSAPSSVSGSASRSRTPTPTAGHTHMRRSTPNSPVQFATDESSQESASSTTCNTSEQHKNGTLSKLSLEHQITTASPEPEIVAMSILATNTVQALGTLMEVVTPTTSTENFDLFHSQDSQTNLHSSSSESPPSDPRKDHNVLEVMREPQSYPPAPTLEKYRSSLPAPTLEKHRSSLPAPTLEKHRSSLPAPTLEKPKPESRLPVPRVDKPHSYPPAPRVEKSHQNNESDMFPSSSVTSVQSRPTSSSKQKSNIPSSLTTKQRRVASRQPPVRAKTNHKPTPLSPFDTSSKLPSPKQNGIKPLTPPSTKTADMNGEQRDNRNEETSSDVCLEDDEDFFGYCHQCGKAVVGEETGCLALGKVFHTTCFSCYTCRKSLSGKTFYTVGQDILCEVDYQKRLQRCCFCNQRIKDKVLTAFGEVYHPACFRCAECGVCLDGVRYAGESHDRVYCLKDYHQLFAPLCASCGKPIIPTPGKAKNLRVQVKDKYYHVRCFKCEGCGMLFASAKQQSFMVTGHLYCHKCHVKVTETHVRTTVL